MRRTGKFGVFIRTSYRTSTYLSYPNLEIAKGVETKLREIKRNNGEPVYKSHVFEIWEFDCLEDYLLFESCPVVVDAQIEVKKRGLQELVEEYQKWY